MKLLETEWINYRNAVIPNDASIIQLQESRRAFYGGAWAFYMLMMNKLESGTGDNATEQDLAMMKKLDEEMREFRDRVVKGWA